MPKKTVLVIGGGIAGHEIGFRLREAADVTMVDPGGAVASDYAVIATNSDQAILAISLARAMATTRRGPRANIAPSQEPAGAPLRSAYLATVTLPQMSRPLRSR